jgi:hypothetical protein
MFTTVQWRMRELSKCIHWIKNQENSNEQRLTGVIGEANMAKTSLPSLAPTSRADRPSQSTFTGGNSNYPISHSTMPASLMSGCAKSGTRRML